MLDAPHICIYEAFILYFHQQPLERHPSSMIEEPVRRQPLPPGLQPLTRGPSTPKSIRHLQRARRLTPSHSEVILPDAVLFPKEMETCPLGVATHRSIISHWFSSSARGAVL